MDNQNIYLAKVIVELEVYAKTEGDANRALLGWHGEGTIKDSKTNAVVSWDGSSKVQSLRQEY